LSRCVHVVASVGVADALGEEAGPVAALASKVDCNAEALNRVLRLLAAHGIFESGGDGFYQHNEASSLLRSDHPQSLRTYARFIGSPAVWQSWGALEHSVRTGDRAVDAVISGGLFAWFADNPEEADIFDQAMAGKAQGQVGPIVGSYDFSSFTRIGDIGGGRGHLLRAVLQAAPDARGVLSDLPHVIEEARPIASERLELQAGDFFTDPLPHV
jgi:O-methyltransferase domain